MPDDQVRHDQESQPAVLHRELYFPTFIYFKDLPNGKSINAAIKPQIYKWREEDEQGIVRSNMKCVGSWHSKVDMHMRDEYREVAQQIRFAAQQIFEDLHYDPDFEAAFDNMWANINPRYGYNRNHVHPHSLWSGVYYVQVPEKAGRIFFTDPRPQVPMCSPRFPPDERRRAESWVEVFFEPIEGRVILFPAWLLHEVEPNMSEVDGPEGDRISISFNILQRRREKA